MVPGETAGRGGLTTRTNQPFVTRLTIIHTHSQLEVTHQPSMEDLELGEGEESQITSSITFNS